MLCSNCIGELKLIYKNCKLYSELYKRYTNCIEKYTNAAIAIVTKSNYPNYNYEA